MQTDSDAAVKEERTIRDFRKHSGFTLLEVLVAVTLLVMISSIVFGTFFYTINNAEQLEERATLYHSASFILESISRSGTERRVSVVCVLTRIEFKRWAVHSGAAL